MKQDLMEALPPAVVSRETEARIEAFVPLLLRWNARINLIGPMTEAVVRQRHVADRCNCCRWYRRERGLGRPR
ncbi:hypothetical protein ACFQU7_17510 [Pseudoroseomonas wenyumeiae]